jgi:hypothetical protein
VGGRLGSDRAGLAGGINRRSPGLPPPLLAERIVRREPERLTLSGRVLRRNMRSRRLPTEGCAESFTAPSTEGAGLDSPN